MSGFAESVGLGSKAEQAINPYTQPAVDKATLGYKDKAEKKKVEDKILEDKNIADAKVERQRVRRQETINILTDRPGRGGTILTDQYQYKV